MQDFVFLVLVICSVGSTEFSCESTLHKNLRISKESILHGATRLSSSFSTSENCISQCCSLSNCTTISYYPAMKKCILYDCGDPDVCLRVQSLKSNLLEVVKVPTSKGAIHPFWSNLQAQSKQQMVLAISVLALVTLVFLVSLLACVYICCRQCKHQRAKGRHNRKPRGVGGSYHILFNSDGEEPTTNGTKLAEHNSTRTTQEYSHLISILSSSLPESISIT